MPFILSTVEPLDCPRTLWSIFIKPLINSSSLYSQSNQNHDGGVDMSVDQYFYLVWWIRSNRNETENEAACQNLITHHWSEPFLGVKSWQDSLQLCAVHIVMTTDTCRFDLRYLHAVHQLLTSRFSKGISQAVTSNRGGQLKLPM